MQSFDTVLIANRGEIALRVIRTAKAMGYRTVAVYSEADRNSLHVQNADLAVCIGPAEVGKSYLNIEAILAAAKCSGANAIHPGYGFLSENPDFVDDCTEAGITFIGPSSHAMNMMGNKRQAKIAMIDAGVPCIPGYNEADQSDTALITAAAAIGYPIMIKAAAGGGGRGMRIVNDKADMHELLSSARSEAENAFGNGELILEKAIVEPRHIEIQVFADKHGNCVYLGERDCSIQRRHQKVVEEAPSPFLDEPLRQAMGEAAVRTAKACDYVGAGTVEFLVDHTRNFYFLEMNTRLQVEHPVTELITGTDLVAWQLKVANGETLPLKQEEISLKGHAIEVRLYAEDPRHNFLPQTGTVELWHCAEGEHLRADHMLSNGMTVTPHYDPMLAKLIAYGENREDARRRLWRMLENSALLGVKNNRHFLSRVIAHPVFRAGEATTAFLTNDFIQDESMHSLQLKAEHWTLAAALLQEHSAIAHNHDITNQRWGSLLHPQSTFQLGAADCEVEVSLQVKSSSQGLHCSATVAEQVVELCLIEVADNHCVYELDGVRRTAWLALRGDTLYFSTPDGDICIEDRSRRAAASAQGDGDGRITAVMDGVIVNVLVESGENVQQGDTLLLMEAMKMEHPLRADVDGVVEVINVKAGDQVKAKQLLAQVVANE